MKGVNRAYLLGYVGRDPQQRGAVVTFSVATDEATKDSSGNWTFKPEWHNVVCFGNEAKYAAQYLKKGSRVFIEGKLHTSSYDDPDSTRKLHRTEIYVNDLKILQQPDNGKQRQSSAAASRSAAPARPATHDRPAQPAQPARGRA
jgi:single-strand DNA-binding protein